VQLTFTEDALDYIVDKAVALKLGARGLRSIVESIMNNAMFEIPGSKQRAVEVTREYAVEQYEQNFPERLA